MLLVQTSRKWAFDCVCVVSFDKGLYLHSLSPSSGNLGIDLCRVKSNGLVSHPGESMTLIS